MQHEPFVSSEKAAAFLGINRRFLLSLARKGIAGAYPIGTGDFRKTWVFRLSELAVAIDPKIRHGMSAAPEIRYDPNIRRSPRK